MWKRYAWRSHDWSENNDLDAKAEQRHLCWNTPLAVGKGHASEALQRKRGYQLGLEAPCLMLSAVSRMAGPQRAAAAGASGGPEVMRGQQ